MPEHEWVTFKVSRLLRCARCRLLQSVYLRRMAAGQPSPCDPADVARTGLFYLSEQEIQS